MAPNDNTYAYFSALTSYLTNNHELFEEGLQQLNANAKHNKKTQAVVFCYSSDRTLVEVSHPCTEFTHLFLLQEQYGSLSATQSLYKKHIQRISQQDMPSLVYYILNMKLIHYRHTAACH